MSGEPEETTKLGCAACGGPLTPGAGAIRVECGYCHTVNEIASSGAVRVAKRLEQLGIRVPDQPMTVADIEADLAERDAARREQTRTMMIVVGVLVTLAVAGLAIALAAG